MAKKKQYFKTILIPLSEWNKHHDAPTVAQLRNMRMKGDENGFNELTMKFKERVYIDESRFLKWYGDRSKGS